MADVKVLHKKSCAEPSTDCNAYVKQFLIVDESGRKYLVPRFVNMRGENVTAVRAAVTQYDCDGERISTSEARLRVSSGAAGKPFVADDKIPLSDRTVDCKIKLISAEYGKYVYGADGSSSTVGYNDVANELDDGGRRSDYAVKAGKSGINISVRTAKTPLLIIFALVLALALAAGAIFIHLDYFVKHEKTFLYSGVEYAFEDDDKSDGSNIYVVGYHGARSRIVIPKQIEGHKVISVAERAFAGNKSLTSIGFEIDLPIGDSAFENCINLREVQFDKITEIGDNAFRNCKKLKSVVIGAKIKRIPKNAFADCSALSSVLVTDVDGQKIQIEKYAFSNCQNLMSVEILRDIDFSYNKGNYSWFSNAAIEKLHITTYDVNPDTGKSTAIASMFGRTEATGYSDAKLKELVIDRLDFIPADFCKSLPIVSFEVKSIGATEIASGAFMNCGNLSRFVFPKPVTAVHDRAFLGAAVTTFNGAALSVIGNSAFAECRELKSFLAASNTALNEIGATAFSGCSALTSFTLPRGVSEISYGTFENCTSLAEFKYARGATLSAINERAFRGCSALRTFYLPDDELTFISGNAFADCTSLESFDIPEKIAYIGDEAFRGCSALTSVKIPDGILSVGKGVFSDCAALAELTTPFLGNSRENESYLTYSFGANSKYAEGKYLVPQSLASVTVTGGTEIGDYAFFGCSDIIKINIPQSIERIGDNAFALCSSLAAIDLPDGLLRIGQRAFDDCSALTSITVPSRVSVIGYSSFGGCSSLKTLITPFIGGSAYENDYLAYVFGNNDRMSGGNGYVPTSLETVEVTSATAVGDYAFANCAGLRNVLLSDGLLTIGSRAFVGCTELTSLAVPDSVTEIRRGAFFGSAFRELVLPFLGLERTTFAGDWDETKRLSYAYYGDYYMIPEELNKITLTDSTYIAAGALSGFKYLEQFTIDCDVQDIGSNAFGDCYRLFEVFNYGSRLAINKGSTDYGGIARYALKVHTDRAEEPLKQYVDDKYRFVRDDDGAMYMLDCAAENNLTLPSAVNFDDVTVGEYSVWRRLFSQCGVIISVFIPSSVTDLGEAAFESCSNLERVEFAETSPIKRIKAETFMYCSSLYELTLPTGLGDIEYFAFSACSRLKKVTVPSGTVAIGIDAFIGCTRLFEVYNHSSLDITAGSSEHGRIAEYARAVYTDDGMSIDSVTVNGVQYMKLGDNGTDWWAVDYYGMNGVLEIKPFTANGKTVDRIGIYESAFKNNGKFTKAVISNVVGRIGTEFEWCYNLSEISLTGGGAYEKIAISDEAFATLNLTRFTSATPVSTVGRRAFKTDRLARASFNARVDRVSEEAFFSDGTYTALSAEFADVGVFDTNAFTTANLKSINVAGTTDSIERNAFVGLPLVNAEFKDVKEIGEHAFSDCAYLTTVTFGNTDVIGDYAFYNTGLTGATFGAVNNVGAYAFARTSALKTAVFSPNDGFAIGNSAFERSGLTAFQYGGRISAIGDNAFANCTGLVRLSLGEVGTIGNNAFVDCRSLGSLVIAGNVEKIGDYAFSYVPLTSVSFGGNIGEIGFCAFRGVSVTALNFTHNVGAIGSQAFRYCGNLVSVEFNGSLASLGERAFADCGKLERLALPTGLRAVAPYAFNNCAALEEAIIPDGVTSIGEYAFANCNGLHRIELPSTLTTLNSEAFRGCENILAVYNASRLSLDSADLFGCALVVSSDRQKTLLSYAVEGIFEFVKADGAWYLYNVMYSSGNVTVLPESFDSNGERITSYKIRGGATRNIYNDLLIRKSATALQKNAVRDGISTVYFDGTEQEWRAVDGAGYVSATVYYRSDCLHEGSSNGLWRYSSYGLPTFAPTVFEDSAWKITKPSTCTETGARKTTCPHCKKELTESIGLIPHNFDGSDACTMCGKIRTVVKKSNVASISEIKNDERYPFEISDDGEIKSTNKADGSTSVFTLTADTATDVMFDIKVSSERGCDYFTVRLNGNVLYSISDSDVRTDIIVRLAAGDTLTFSYSKDVSASSGSDCGYITNLTLIYAEA